MKKLTKYLMLRQIYEDNKNPEIAASKGKYMRNLFPFFGLPSPNRRALDREIIASDRKSGLIDWDFLDKCWDDEHREMQYFVSDYLGAMKKFLVYDDVTRIERFIRTKQWWDTIDFLDKIVGSIAFTDKRINDLMLRWSVDDNFWVRRVAIDHQIGQKSSIDTALLETIIVNNLGSKEFFINKAIGWSLRDFSKFNPDWVRTFISKYHGRLSKLSIREGGKYV